MFVTRREFIGRSGLLVILTAGNDTAAPMVTYDGEPLTMIREMTVYLDPQELAKVIAPLLPEPMGRFSAKVER